MFIEEALCVALHPSAHSVLVGFTNKLRLFTVLLDDFKCAPWRSLVVTARDMCGPHVRPDSVRGCRAAMASSSVHNFLQISGASRFWPVCRDHDGMPLGGAGL